MCSAFLPTLSVSNDDDDHLDEKSKSTFQLFNIATEHLICEEKEEGGRGVQSDLGYTILTNTELTSSSREIGERFSIAQ